MQQFTVRNMSNITEEFKILSLKDTTVVTIGIADSIKIHIKQ